jgi:hypothetical protein
LESEFMQGVRICLLAALIAAFAVAPAQKRPAPNAFLNRAVSGTSELIQQVQTDPSVRDRYLRHYAMQEDELYRFLAGLRVSRLEQDQTLTVYNVPDSGELRASTRTYRRGTRVFVDSRRQTQMILQCGNPVNRGPEQPESLAALEELPDEKPITLAQTHTQNIEILPAHEEDQERLVALAPSYTAPLDGDLVAPVAVTTTTTATMPVAAVPAVFPWLLPLAGGALLALGAGGGGAEPVPEPASIIALGAATGLLLRRRRQRI